jgi:hypothetical protein
VDIQPMDIQEEDIDLSRSNATMVEEIEVESE